MFPLELVQDSARLLDQLRGLGLRIATVDGVQLHVCVRHAMLKDTQQRVPPATAAYPGSGC